MKKLRKVLAVLSVLMVATGAIMIIHPQKAYAVTAIFQWVFAPNTSNGGWVSGFMNQTPVNQTAGPVPFPTGNTVLTVSVDSSECPNTDYDPVGFEYERYSTDGGRTWVIMSETWTVITLPHNCTTGAQIVTVQQPAWFDVGPMTEQVTCPKGG